MSRSVLGVVATCLAITLTAATIALFRGCFDQGTFQVRSVVWSPAGKAAILAERSDDQALNSDEFYVFLDDHVPSVREVRSALYSKRPVFSCSNSCLGTRWKDASHLLIFCRDGIVGKDQINRHRDRAGDVVVEFENIRVR